MKTHFPGKLLCAASQLNPATAREQLAVGQCFGLMPIFHRTHDMIYNIHRSWSSLDKKNCQYNQHVMLKLVTTNHFLCRESLYRNTLKKCISIWSYAPGNNSVMMAQMTQLTKITVRWLNAEYIMTRAIWTSAVFFIYSTTALTAWLYC